MSSENANSAVVLRSFETFEPGRLHGDWANIWRPDAWTTAAPDWPEPGPFEGRDAIVTQFERLFADWSEYRLEDVEIKLAKGEWVIATWSMWARGIGSGLEMRLEVAAAIRVIGDAFAEAHFRWSLDDAMAAAGLA